MRRPIRLTGLLTIALMLIATLPPLAPAGAAQEASPVPDGLPEREVEGLPTANTTIRVTFLGCEDGVDPQVTPEQCTTPLAAPDTAYFAIAPDMVTYVNTLPVDQAGTYEFPAFPSETITLNEFFRSDYNSFMFEGVDANERWQSSVLLESGEIREVTVYYWNGPEGLIEPGENTVSVTVLGCPEGVDPHEDATGCMEPIDAPETLYVQYGGNLSREGGPLNDYARDDAGTYTFDTLAPYTQFSLHTMIDSPDSDPVQYLFTGDAESITADEATVYALRGETRELTVYVYNRDNGADTGAIRIGFWGCPEGVDPNVDASSCTIPLDAPAAARVVHRGDLLNVVVAEQPRADGGTYIIEDVIPEGYPIVGLDHDGYGSFLIEGLTESGLVGNVIEVRPGETTEIQVYYYNA